MIIVANLKVTWYEGRLDMDNVRDTAERGLRRELEAGDTADINVDGEVYVVTQLGNDALDLIAGLEVEGYDERCEWTVAFEDVQVDPDED